MNAAYLAAGIALGGLLFTVGSYFINLGGTLVDQSVRVFITVEERTVTLHNFSDNPVSNIQFFYGTETNNRRELVSPRLNFAKAGGEVRAHRLPGDDSFDSINVRYVGIRGLTWQQYGDGRRVFFASKPRGYAIKLMTWPWLHHELRNR